MIIRYFEEGRWWVAATNHPDSYPRSSEVTVDDPLVTVDSLVETWESDLEAANYHSMMDMPDKLVALLRKHGIPDVIVKRVIWDIIDLGGWIA